MKLTTIGETGEIFFLNDKVVSTWFTSKTRQLFDVNGKCYIYKMDSNKLYEIPFNKAITIMAGVDEYMSYEPVIHNIKN